MNRHSPLFGQLDDFFHPVIAGTYLHVQVIGAPRALQGFLDRIDTKDQLTLHGHTPAISSTISSAAAPGSVALAIGRPITR